MYKCEKCGKYFNQKSHYDTHLQRKRPCIKFIDQDRNHNIATPKTDDKSNPNVIHEGLHCHPMSSTDTNIYICLICHKKFKFR